jgi:hypothetical protein
MNQTTKLHASKPRSIHSLAPLAGGLRRAVTARLMRDFGVRIPPPLIRRVLDEAMAVAQETGFPNLFFPAVAEEKARLVSVALAEPPADHSTHSLSHAA